jgi:hypothetical protein
LEPKEMQGSRIEFLRSKTNLKPRILGFGLV